MEYKKPYKARLKYEFDNFIGKGSVRLISWLGLITMVLIIFFALLLLVLGLHPNHNEDFNILNAFWTSITHVLDPGTLGEHEELWPFRFYMLFVSVVGLVIISTLIGLVSNGILIKIEELKKGRSFVIEKDHVLILGWSPKIFTIISELVVANENQKRGVIVILAEKDKVEMEDEIKDKVGNTKNTRVICRTGNPIDVHDLYIANPYESKSIIILGKENENSDSQTIKAIVAIVTNPNRRKEPYHITAEMVDKKNLDVARMVGEDEVELIYSDLIISRIMVQTSRQSGLSVVYIELMDFGGDEIYFQEEKSLVGKTFREAIFAYEDSAIMGLQYADESVEINPPMNTVLKNGDKVIGITEDDDTLIANAGDYIIHDDKIVFSVSVPQKSERIIMIGWNGRARHIIVELDNYVAQGSILKVTSKFEDPKKAIKKIDKELKNLTLEFEQLDTSERSTLLDMELNQYDYIILLSYEGYFPIQEADAQSLITLLHLRNFSERLGHKYKIVSEMLDIRNRQLADITSADDFIVSDRLVSLLMSQVSENKYLMRVFEDLFDAEGSEIYIKAADEYVRTGVPINFYTLLESAARKNQIAIGYRRMKFARESGQGYGVIVNPPKSQMFTLDHNDMVIVISED